MRIHIEGNEQKTVCGRDLAVIEYVDGWGPRSTGIDSADCRKCLEGAQALGRWADARLEALGRNPR